MRLRLRRLAPAMAAFVTVLVVTVIASGDPGSRPLTAVRQHQGPQPALFGATRGHHSGKAAAPTPGVVVRSAVKHDLSIPFRAMAPKPTTPYIEREPGPLRPAGLPGVHAPDPAVQSSPPANPAPPTSENFEGNDISDISDLFVGAPPDTNGDVGPNHYMQWVNTIISVYDKSGNRVFGPVNGNTLWSGFGGLCEQTNDGDPVVQYDPLADRWMVSQFAFVRDLATGLPVPPYDQCIAVSQTPDPTGAYYRYDFEISKTKLNDYPHFGVWPDAYYMSINQFNSGTLDSAGAAAVAFERQKMLLGQDARMVYVDEAQFDPNNIYGGQLPADLDGTTPPPAGEPNFFMQFLDSTTAGQDKMLEWKFHVDWNNPASSTFGNGTTQGTPIQFPVADFDSNLCDHGNDRACIPQQGTTVPDDNLDAIADRLMFRLAYRNFGDHESIVANDTVNAGGGANHAGIRWYEIRNPNGAPTVFQQGTFAPDAKNRWMGSIAMDSAGNIALGYSVSDATMHPAVRYSGRLAGDPPGVLTIGEGSIIEGAGSQVGTSNRWGDYSSMSVDPDGCTFWYTQEYYAATGSFGWSTRIGSFSFPTCGDPQIGMSGPESVGAHKNITYVATVKGGAAGAPNASVTDALPAGLTPISVSSSVGTCALGLTVSCALGNIAPGGSATVTIVARAGDAGSIDNDIHLGTTGVDADLTNNVASVTTLVQDPCSAPGITLVSDVAGDALDMQDQHDLRSISVAEPYNNGAPGTLIFTLKMTSLGGTLSPNTSWPIYFTIPNGQARYVDMETNQAGTVSFHYGTVTVEGPTGQFGYYGDTTAQGTPDAGTFNPDGTIKITIAESKFGLNPGDAITKFQSRVSVNAVAGSFTPDNSPNNTLAPAGSYTLAGQAGCQPADLVVTNTDSPDPVALGQSLTYTLTVTNQGIGPAPATVLYDQLPANVTFVSADGGCTQANGSVLCNLGTLAANAVATRHVVIKPTSQAGSPITAGAFATSGAPDPTPASANASTVVTNQVALTCPGYKRSTLHQIVGTKANDILTGTAGVDVICGNGGNDTIYGLDSNDILLGGPGADLIYGGTGNDTIQPGGGDDKAYGEDGVDTIKDAAGSDELHGGPGNDTLIGAKGADHEFGEEDNDLLRMQDNIEGNDSGDGGDGTDTCKRDKGDHVINCEAS